MNSSTNTGFLNELSILKKPVWNILQEYLPNKEPKKHYKIVSDYPKRQGKYLRPALVLLSAQMYGAKKESALLSAVAMQLSEEWLLVHDDFLDHSLERRSTVDCFRPALNKLYGDELAINAGDVLHSIMWQVLSDNIKSLRDDRGWRINDKMHDIILRVLEGQFTEVNWIRENKINLTRNDYYKMIYIKSGYYTITGPLQLGAIVAGVKNNELDKIEKWGMPFGCAFQLWDDVMNVSVDSGIQGKERGGDILEGKRTLILIHLLNKCSDQEKNEIKRIYRKSRSEKNEAEKNYIIQLMEKYGSIEYAKKIALKFSQKAKKIFLKDTSRLKNSHAKEMLGQAINFVVNRKR